MEFTPAFTKASSNSCQTLTITDTSNWAANDENLYRGQFNRSVTVYDINNNVIGTQALSTTNDVAVFTLNLLAIPMLIIQVTLNLNGVSTNYNFSLGKQYVLPCLLP